jgi:ABC-type glutathione transport system ATPase component
MTHITMRSQKRQMRLAFPLAPRTAQAARQHRRWAHDALSQPDMTPILSIQGTQKTYASGVQALKPVHLDIMQGEIFALLGPNGAGKTTLISIICGIVTPSAGTIIANGFDVAKDWRGAHDHWSCAPGIAY